MKTTNEIKEITLEFMNFCKIDECDCDGCKYDNDELPCKVAFYRDKGYNLISENK